MRQEPNVIVDKFRKSHPMYPDTEFGDSCGYFEVDRTDMGRKYTLRMISSGLQSRGGWEHVSVSIEDRCPSWDDMCFVKSLFWEPEETVLQFHPAKSDYVNIHEFCLHLWKQAGFQVELPPTHLV